MKTRTSRTQSWKKVRQGLVAIGCAGLILPGEGLMLAQTPVATPTPAPAVPAELAEAKIPPEQLDSLVAPLALYPDPLLAQTLVAATYPLEIIQLHQWLAKNKTLKDKALADAAAKQPWDPAVQSMAAVPDVVKRLSDDIQWTTELGNAFLAQQSDVMDAVQRMRQKAKGTGALASNEQQKVETTVVAEKTVIVVQPTNPEVIYVPSYSPTVVYGPPVYAYPPIYYPPPPPPGAAFVSFGVGMMFGAAIWGGGWGCGWGHNDVNVNVNRNFNNNNINVDRGGGGGGNNWSHNPEHRGAAPYSNKATADKFGGSTRGQSAAGNRATPSTSASNRSTAGSRGGAAGPSTMDRSGSGASRGSSPSASNRSAGASASNRSAGTGGNQIGSRDMSSSSASRSSGFSGGSSGFSGSSARASSSRGASSFGGSRGGGGGRRR